MSDQLRVAGARIYNLFPRLAGPMTAWGPHLDRAAEMGFNWIYVNPLHYPGFSGSLYAPKDYYGFNPLFLDPASGLSPMGQMEKMLAEARGRGLKVMMDLVVNHTAKDHPFTKEHSFWYVRDEKGALKSPGAWDGGKWIEWGDLAEIDNENSPDRDALWAYWRDLVLFYLGKGFDGFRADAAYQVPNSLWDHLITAAKSEKPDAHFFAESLGCEIGQTVELGRHGFDYVFNSSKWWDFQAPWLLDHYRMTRESARSVSFPESHDTERLPVETGGRLSLVKQRAAFTACFSSAWMVPMGFEYGFRKRMDVVKTTPADWEKPSWDLTGWLKAVNAVKGDLRVLNEESEISVVDDVPDRMIRIFHKISSDDREQALILLNLDPERPREIAVPDLRTMLVGMNAPKAEDLSPDRRMVAVALKDFRCELEPAGFKLLRFGS